MSTEDVLQSHVKQLQEFVNDLLTDKEELKAELRKLRNQQKHEPRLIKVDFKEAV